MPHVMSFYDHTCLKAFHLGGREKTLTIERVSKAEVRNATAKGTSKATKLLLHFRGHQLPLICGKTVARTIVQMYGNDTALWLGKAVTVFPSMTRGAEGGDVECIRVRPGIPQQPSAPETASPQLPSAPPVVDADFEESR